MLCLLALRHAEAREFLQAQDWREMLAQTPDAEILGRILEADLRPDDPASINAFMSGLSPGDEGAGFFVVTAKDAAERPGGGARLVERPAPGRFTPPASDRGRPHETAPPDHGRSGQFAETNS